VRIRVEEERDVAMRLDRALGPAGRPGRVIEVERRVRVDRGQRRSGGDACRGVERDDGAPGGRNGARAVEQRRVGHDRARVAVGDDLPLPLRGIAGVQHDVGVPAAHRAKNRLDRADPALEQQRDAPRFASRARLQPRGNVGRGRVKLPVRDDGIALDERRLCGMAVRDLRKSRADGRGFGSVRRHSLAIMWSTASSIRTRSPILHKARTPLTGPPATIAAGIPSFPCLPLAHRGRGSPAPSFSSPLRAPFTPSRRRCASRASTASATCRSC